MILFGMVLGEFINPIGAFEISLIKLFLQFWDELIFGGYFAQEVIGEEMQIMVHGLV